MDTFKQLYCSGFAESGFQTPAIVGVQIRIPDPDADPDFGFHDQKFKKKLTVVFSVFWLKMLTP
jgi:hypothetical protein